VPGGWFGQGAQFGVETKAEYGDVAENETILNCDNDKDAG